MCSFSVSPCSKLLVLCTRTDHKRVFYEWQNCLTTCGLNGQVHDQVTAGSWKREVTAQRANDALKWHRFINRFIGKTKRMVMFILKIKKNFEGNRSPCHIADRHLADHNMTESSSSTCSWTLRCLSSMKSSFCRELQNRALNAKATEA